MRLRTLIAGVTLPLLVWALVPVLSSGQTGSAASLQQKIQTTQSKIGRKKGAERSLSKDIRSYTKRIESISGRIDTLQARQDKIQADLDDKQAELSRLQAQLRYQRARLVRLRARLVESRQVLAQRLVELYQADKPDLVTVILNAKGFADLIERSEFLGRINDQDTRIIANVRSAKGEATSAAKRLGTLEKRQAKVTKLVEQRRNEIREIKDELVGTRVGYSRTRNAKTGALQKVRSDRHELEEDLEAMERQQAKIAAALSGAGNGIGLPAGPIRQGSGAMIWPVNGTFTSPFGYRWGRLHAGVDLAAPEGTPIRAAMAGKVVLMQPVASSGGYGNYTCVQHTTSMSTCYAHQVRFGTSMGARLSKGQVLGYVGNTGHSFGAHLHFEVRINGQPTDPMQYL